MNRCITMLHSPIQSEARKVLFRRSRVGSLAAQYQVLRSGSQLHCVRCSPATGSSDAGSRRSRITIACRSRRSRTRRPHWPRSCRPRTASTPTPPRRRLPRSTGLRVEGRRKRDGVRVHRVRPTPVACGQRTPLVALVRAGAALPNDTPTVESGGKQQVAVNVSSIGLDYSGSPPPSCAQRCNAGATENTALLLNVAESLRTLRVLFLTY